MQYQEITFQKTFCLLGVIFFHAVLPFAANTPFWKLYAAEQSVVAIYLALLASYTIIPSFIFASGFLLASRMHCKQPSVWDNIKNRGKRLLLPWFFTMLFWLVPMYTLFSIPAYMHPADTTLFEGYRQGLLGLFVDHLWFLLVLFWVSAFWSLVLPLIEKRGRFLGAVLAVVAAVGMNVYGQGLSLYCIKQTGEAIIFFYLGYCAYHRQAWLKNALTQHPVRWLPAVALALALVFSVPRSNFGLIWLLKCCGCLLTYQLSLWGLRVLYPCLQGSTIYLYFEKNAFRYYLFHMPVALLVFMAVERLNILAPLPAIFFIFIATYVITSGIVHGTHVLQKLYVRRQPRV